MLTLAIETSNPSAVGRTPGPGCALGVVGSDGSARTIDVEPLRATTRHDDDLVPCIDRLCRRAGVAPNQLKLVAVSVGPGGYTALRVGVAAAKLIAEAAGARCAAVPSAAAVAIAAAIDGPLAVALAGKADSSFITCFPAGWPGGASSPLLVPDGRLVNAAGLAALSVTTLIADEHLPEALRTEASRLGLAINPTVFDPAAVLAAAARLPHIDPAQLLPLYAREPEAVTLWRQRHAQG